MFFSQTGAADFIGTLLEGEDMLAYFNLYIKFEGLTKKQKLMNITAIHIRDKKFS